MQSGDAFKVAQAIYNAVTGKTEKLTQLYDKNFRIDRESLNQLHAKLSQMTGQWQVIQSTDSITVHHTNDNKDVFSSFERFSIYDRSRAEPVESIVYQYNFLMAMPKAEKPQPYTITVRLLSRAATYDKLERGMPQTFLRVFQRGTITVEIDYVDYVVARNILSTLDSWVAEITVIPEMRPLLWLQNRSHWVPRVFHFTIFAVGFFAVSRLASGIDASATPKTVGQLILFALPFLWIALHIAKAIGHVIEEQLDRYAPLSYILLNVGDERVVEKATMKNKSFCRRAITWTASILIEGLCIGLATEWLYDQFK